MKTITSLFLASVAFTASLALTPQAAARDLSIVGSIETTAGGYTVLEYPYIAGWVHGDGHARHLGRYALAIEGTVNVAANTTLGTFSIVAANGDKLIGTLAGTGTPTGVTNELLIVELMTIESGTGRFKGASGTITMSRLADITTVFTSGTIEGTITVPDNRGHHRN
jgi:hypothetical protein